MATDRPPTLSAPAGSRGRGVRWTRILAGIYLLLLLASHAVRWRGVGEPPSDPALRFVSVAVDAGGAAPREVRLAYRSWGPGGAAGGPVVLLLHGSPGSSLDFATLGPALGTRYRVLAPDLPGFGASERRVPDYSLAAHARHALALLDRLGVAEAHLVGFSMGGGAALEAAGRAPARVRSLTLLASIGVQELELLGDYHLNHAIHGLQLAGLALLHEGVPHFGLLDGALLDVPYARNFFDSDQRPLRGILSSLPMPVLILHGERDFLVPPAAAREHHRLVPQSELEMLDGGHFMVFGGGDRLAGPIGDFIARAAAGTAPTRARASEARRGAAAAPFDPRSVPRATGIALGVLLVLLAAATLVSEDLTCVAAGLLVAAGRIGFVEAAAACFLGILVGDVLLFWAGRLLGRPALARRPLRWLVSADAIERASRWFRARGPAVILLSRFLPGTRLPVYFAAGLLRTSFRQFLAWFALAVALWTPLLVGLAALLGSRVLKTFEAFERWAALGFAASLVVVWLVTRVVGLALTWRGRRRLVGWWRRTTRWEFWPVWLFYLPVLAWMACLALRHRSAGLFTAANPGIPAGGFIGESKAAILDRLPADSVAAYRRVAGDLPSADKLAAVRAFAAERGLSYPLVLKPDVGQRGNAVAVVRGEAEARAYLRRADFDLLVQEYVPGSEYGVFYVRLPGDARGRIFSITDKRLPRVVGDGRRTVEELVLADPRAVALASVYLRGLGARALDVPAAGARVRLTDLGTHCRGALFLDGRRLRTPELERTVDAWSRACPGFFFGRYDLRAPSEQALRAGRDLKILELNGVTSEATHIYDPGGDLLAAYRTLFRQWSLAFETGRRNRERGARPAGAGELLRRLLLYWRRPPRLRPTSPPAA